MPGRADPSLEPEVRSRLARMYDTSTRDWELLEVYAIPRALPVLPACQFLARPVRLGPGRYVCGDHRDTPSIQGALVSGRRAARAVLADLHHSASALRRAGFMTPAPGPARPWLIYALTTAAAGAAAVAGSLPVDPGSAWYRGVAKPRWQPPPQAFGAVWAPLYASIAWAGGRALGRARGPPAARASGQPGREPGPERHLDLDVLRPAQPASRAGGDCAAGYQQR